jgi:hypothetical protein
MGDMKSTNFGRQGQAGALGHNYDPFLVDRDPNSSSFQVEAFSTPDSVGIERLTDRASLLRSVDRFQSGEEWQLRFAKTHDAFAEQAFDLLTSQRAKRAFDIEQEPKRIRDAYGRNRVGQGLLLARRLIESGVRFVTVKGYVRYGWDHHPEVFPRLRTEVPPYDQRAMRRCSRILTVEACSKTRWSLPRANSAELRGSTRTPVALGETTGAGHSV